MTLPCQSFGPHTAISFNAQNPQELQVGDLNGDGFDDLAVCSRNDNSLSWFPNDQNGQFLPEVLLYTEGDFPSGLDLADMDADGDLDILAAFRNGGNILIFLNDGLGTFSSPDVVSSAVNNAVSLRATDMDGDGDLDIVSCSLSLGLQWHENEGDGTFITDHDIFSSNNYIAQVESADLDNDGDMDLAYRTPSTNVVAWMENDGNGQFVESILSTQVTDAAHLEIADLENDGISEIFSCIPTLGKVIQFSQTGSGDFDEGVVIVDELGYNLEVFELVDMDQDGDLDIGLGNLNSTVWGTCENDGGSFGSAQSQNNAQQVSMMLSVDMENDAEMEMLCGNNSDLIALIKADIPFEFELIQIVNSESYAVQVILSGDLDGDGDEDVIAAGQRTLKWYENIGDLDFLDGVTLDFYPYSNVVDAEILDMDMDGDLDILALRNQLYWLENDGSAQFTFHSIGFTGSRWTAHAVDIDADGDLDVLSGYTTTLKSYINDGSMNFTTGTDIVPNFKKSTELTDADMDGDGDTDIIASFNIEHEIRWFENLENGELGESHLIFDQAFNVRDIICHDFDMDGDMDVVSAEYTSQRIVWYENEGNGEFIEQHLVDCNIPYVWDIQLIDFDNDMDMDLVAGCSSYVQNVEVYENGGLGTFRNTELNEAGQYLSASDLDGDGAQEVLSFTFENQQLAYFHNDLNQGCIDPGACNYDPTATQMGSCYYSDCGCTDPVASNYSPTAINDDGSCTYISGCTDPGALNYDPAATLDDASCQYVMGCNDGTAANYDDEAYCNSFTCKYEISGTVFHDLDENGLYDGTEFGVPGQSLQVIPNGQVTYTDDFGNFIAEVAGGLEYEVNLQLSPEFPFPTTPASLTLDTAEPGWNEDLRFGVTTDSVLYDCFSEIYNFYEGYPCDAFLEHLICFENEAYVPVDVVISVEFDEAFQSFTAWPNIDSADGNTLYLHLNNVAPGTGFCQVIQLQTPTVDAIGDTLQLSALFEGYYSDSLVTICESSFEMDVTCAYDPNDKQVEPAGWTDAHYVSPDQELEYRIRFQNTGNAPATDVWVRDTIDVGLDLESFELGFTSHSAFTSIDPETREVVFYFQDIMLPDSVNNEPESHGVITYTIRPEGDLALLTELNNTAYIFFDNNPAIVTNTTWSTLYDCSLFEATLSAEENVLTASEGDSYQWYWNGELIEGASEQVYVVSPDEGPWGFYSVVVSNGFPCSMPTDSVHIWLESVAEFSGSPIFLFPNPMTSSAMLDLGDIRGMIQVEIYDVLGKLQRSETFNLESGTLNLQRGTLTKGSYLLRLTQDSNSIELPFLVE